MLKDSVSINQTLAKTISKKLPILIDTEVALWHICKTKFFFVTIFVFIQWQLKFANGH